MYMYIYIYTYIYASLYRWPGCVRRRITTDRLLRLRIRIPLGAFFECSLLSVRGLCIVIMCALEASAKRWPWPGLFDYEKKKYMCICISEHEVLWERLNYVVKHIFRVIIIRVTGRLKLHKELTYVFHSGLKFAYLYFSYALFILLF